MNSTYAKRDKDRYSTEGVMFAASSKHFSPERFTMSAFFVVKHSMETMIETQEWWRRLLFSREKAEECALNPLLPTSP